MELSLFPIVTALLPSGALIFLTSPACTAGDVTADPSSGNGRELAEMCGRK